MNGSSDTSNILSGKTGVPTTIATTTTTTTKNIRAQKTDEGSDYDIINNSGINIDSGIISKCDNIAAKLTTTKTTAILDSTTNSSERLICSSDYLTTEKETIGIGDYGGGCGAGGGNGFGVNVDKISDIDGGLINVNLTGSRIVTSSVGGGVPTGTITLCHRFQTQSSTTSDLQQSTSATVDTVATSSGGLILNSRQGSVDGAMQRCGLCSILSRLLRRAMCVGSRRGSGESYYQELPETKTFQSPEAQTIKTTDGAIYVCLMPSHQQKLGSIDTTERDDWRRRVSESDRPLLEALLDEEKHENARRRHLSNGRFLTMHKRRRKKLTTRSLNQDPAILDDVLHGQVQCILNRVGDWRFNAFTLETVTGGRSLPVICVHLFHWYGLLDHFNLDVVRLWKLFTLIEEGYHSTNPYHNSIHATDVTQAMHCFLQERKIYENLKPIEILASLLGAVTHDLDHPGVNQPFLIATSNHLAALYENTSVLENHHWRSAVGCLLESGVAEQIQDIRPIVEKQIASLILATDITRQTEFLETFRKYLDTNTLDMTIAENRHFILQIALKCADISNPCRPWDISKKWSQKVCEEFFRQGDFERQLNLPVTSLCDRFSNSVPKIQVGFFKFVVTPLFIEWHKFLNTKLSTRMMKYLRENEVQWSSRVAAEQAEETKTEISDDDILDEDYIDGGEENIENVDNDNEDDIGEAADICLELSDSSEVLLPDIKLPRRSSLQVPKFGKSHFDRRHSVPVNPPKIILPPRESREKTVSSCGSGTEHGHHASTIREDFESKFDDSFSILSSDSENGFRKSGSFGERERPLSAETLLPELNIATMSKSDCADRLNIVMHGGFNSLSANMLTSNNVSKHLIRQQTFPPLQPYMSASRARYMSAGAEMTGCVVESSSSNSSQIGQSTEPLTYQDSKKKSKKDSFKREANLGNGSYQIEMKSHKMAKLSIPSQKENVDPSHVKLGQMKRRGSAPVDILCTTITATTTTTTGSTSKSSGTDQFNLIVRTCDKFIRRGSMPVDAIHIETTRDNESLLLNPSTFQRRGSIPFDHSSSVNRANNFNGKPRNRKKLLRRRSSGGAEILSPIIAEPDPESSTSSTSQAWYRFKRQKSDVESILNRRRGSLPVEVLAICHSGTLRH